MKKTTSKFVVKVDEWGNITTTMRLAGPHHLGAFIAELGRSQGVCINMRIDKRSK